MPKVNGQVRYQWQTGELSRAIVDAIPPEWLCEAYPGLHNLDLAQAVEKVPKERRKDLSLSMSFGREVAR